MDIFLFSGVVHLTGYLVEDAPMEDDSLLGSDDSDASYMEGEEENSDDSDEEEDNSSEEEESDAGNSDLLKICIT